LRTGAIGFEVRGANYGGDAGDNNSTAEVAEASQKAQEKADRKDAKHGILFALWEFSRPYGTLLGLGNSMRSCGTWVRQQHAFLQDFLGLGNSGRPCGTFLV
jgi:hypothetical protein